MTSAGGPLLFGYCLDIVLYSILTVQTYLYYLAFPEDRIMTKAAVSFVYIIEALQTAFGLRDFYTLFCTLQGNRYLESPADFDIHTFGFMWFTVPLGSTLVATVVQFFYAHRIKVLPKAEKVATIVFMLASMQFLFCAFSTFVTFGPFQSGVVAEMLGVSAFVGPAIGAICDLLISIYMSLYLSKQSKAISNKNTQVIVTKIVRLLLETGILTAGVAIVYAVLISFTPARLHWFLFPGLPLGKLYANSMLVLLNNRFTISGGRNAPHLAFEILSYQHSGLVGGNTRPGVSRSIAAAHSCPEVTAGEIHVIEPSAEQGQISQDVEEMMTT